MKKSIRRGMLGALLCVSFLGTALADYDPSQKATELNALWAGGTKAIFAVGATEKRRALVLLTDDGGKIWSKQALEGKPTMLYGIWGISITNLFSVGAGGTILHTTNGGASWSQQKSGTTDNLFGVWGEGKKAFAVGNNGTILYTANSGKTWSTQSSGTAALLSAAWGRASKEVFVVGNSGTILQTTDGKTWNSITSGTKESLRAISGTKDSIVIVGDHGMILRSADNGKSWSSRGSEKARLNAVWGLGDDFLVVGDGVILRSTDKGETWSKQVAPTDKPTIVGVWGRAASAAYAVTSLGALLHTTDGKTWSYVVTPASGLK
jgi:photosystem II stability/assembly factor-like uncharacterized protein